MEQQSISVAASEDEFMSNLSCSNERINLCMFVNSFASKQQALAYLSKGLDVNYLWYYFFGTFVGLVGILSVFINGKILILYPKAFTDEDKRYENWNLLSLTVADLGMCFLTFPQIFAAAINRGWNLGIYACTFDGAAGAVFSGAQIWSLTATAVERFLVIRRVWKHTPTLKNILWRLAVVWGIPLTTAIMPLMRFGRYMPDGIFISCTFNYVERDTNNVVYVVLLMMMYVAVPVSIICGCYVGIARVTKKSSSHFNSSTGSRANKSSMKRREKALMQTVVIIISCFLASWMPYTIIAIISLCGVEVPGVFATTAVCIAKASTVLNAGLYTALHPNYKKLNPWRKEKNNLGTGTVRCSSTTSNV